MKARFIIAITGLFLVVNISAQCWQQVTAGSVHTIATRSDGTLWAWGAEFSNSTNYVQKSPIQVGTANNWQIIDAGGRGTQAIKSDGTLWAWGVNDQGQIGASSIIPVQIGSANNWKQVSPGGAYTLAIKSDGTLWGWGDNQFGQLGDGTFIDKNTPTHIGASSNWQQVSAGGRHTLAIKSDGTLWAWGRNFYGQLGDGTNVDKNAPIQIGIATNWNQVSAGGVDYSLALKTDGTLWAWGNNSLGQLGDGTNINKNTPTRISTSTNWKEVSAGGGFHVVAIKNDGTLWTWGSNSLGQLGDGTNIDKKKPIQIGVSTNWKQVSAGNSHTVGLKSNGTLWVWGDNQFGQLGDGTNTDSNIPIEIICQTINTSQQILQNDNLQIFPNPAKNYINIKTNNMSTKDLKYTIINIFGETVFSSKNLIDGEKINVEGYAQGVYILTIRDSQYLISKQFVKI